MANKKIDGKKVRLQFDFSQEQVDYLDDVVKKVGAISRAEAVRKVVWFLGWAINKLEKGEPVTLPSNSAELICTVWPAARK